MINRINYRLINKLKSNLELDEEDKELLLENEEFLTMLLTWLSWNDYKARFEAIIDSDETNKAILDYFQKRQIE